MASRKLEVVIVGDSSSLQRALGKANASTKQFGSGVGGHLKNLAKFAAASAGVAGVGLAFSKTASLTVDFDKSMRNVNSIAQLNEKQFGTLSKSVLGLAGKTAQAPKTLADGLYDLVSSGFNAKQSMEILKSSARAATAGLTTTEVSTKAVAAVLNSYHRPAKDAANVSDVLFQTVNRGVITFDQLANNIGTVLPFASSLGVNLNQVGAAISTMTKGGISGELSITYLKNAMVSFLKPSAGMAEAVKKTGYSSGEALVKAKGFQGALEAVIGSTDGTKKSVAKLFPNIRSLTAALALTGKNAKGAHGDLAAFKDVTGATDKALSQQSKSISYQWNQIKATLSSLAIQLGSKLVPAISASIKWLAQFIAHMKAGTGTAGQIRSVVVGAFNAVKAAITTTVAAIVGIVKGFKDGKTWAVALVAALAGFTAAAVAIKAIAIATEAWTAAQLALDAAMSLNPITLAIAAIVGLGAAIVIAYEKSQTFRSIVSGAFNAVKSAVSAAVHFVTALFPAVATAAKFGFLGPIPLIISRFGQIKSGVSAVIREVVSVIKGVRSGAVSAFNGAKNAAVSAFNAVKSGISAAIHFVTGLFPKVAAAARLGFLGPIPLIISRFGQIKDAISTVVSAVVSTIKSIPSRVAGVGQAIVQAILSGMGNIGSAIAGKITGALKGLKGLAHKALKAVTGAATFPGLPSLSAIEGAANSRTSGLLFPATRKGDILETLAKSAVNTRRHELTVAKNNAADAHKAHPKNKQLAQEYDAATRALRNFNVEAKTYVGIFHKQNVGLQAIQKFKDAISGLRDKMHSLAGDAASAFRATREKQIATGPEAQKLKALQDIDAAQQDQQTTDQLNQDLADAKASGDVKAQKAAQDAIDAYARQKQEQALQDQIDAQNAGLDTEETNYQASLDSRLQSLTGNLESGKESYKQYVADVQAILGPLNIAFTGDPDEEQAINPVGAGSAPKGKSKAKHHKRKKRAVGGSVMAGVSYDVGELGPETFTPGTSGTITQASQSKGGGGGIYMDFRGSRIGSQKAARVMANKLAFRVAFG